MFGVFACVFWVRFGVRVRVVISAHNVLQKNNNLVHDELIFKVFYQFFFIFISFLVKKGRFWVMTFLIFINFFENVMEMSVARRPIDSCSFHHHS